MITNIEAEITQEQIQQAMERQRLHGGRLDANLAALGFVSEGHHDFLQHRRPRTPRTIEESGLDASFITDLVMKHLVFMREFKIQDVIERTKLSLPIVNQIIDAIRREKLVEIKGSEGLSTSTVRYAMTEEGKNRAITLLEISRYVGPAPVPLEAYRHMVEVQSVRNIHVGVPEVKEAFSHLVVSDDMLKRLGPAISSGRAIFVYGPPGNGKTTIAETISKILPDDIYIPYAILVGDDVITMYDPVTHIPVENALPDETTDPRWVMARRPVVMTGGELTLRMLDLEFNPISKFYEAPLQMKANNGLFIIDDFGRQQIDPHHLLNRWIVPLERRNDFLSLQSGMKFEIPFDQLSVFATNIEPKKLVDEAFLRRIPYKIKIDHPTEHEFKQVFHRVCASNNLEFHNDVFDFLVENFYHRLGVKFNACHPRDIVDNILDTARYLETKPAMTRESVTTAWENYFVDI